MSAYGQPDETADVHSEFLSMFPRTPIPEEVQPAPSPSEQTLHSENHVFEKSSLEQMIPVTGDSCQHNRNYPQRSMSPSIRLGKPTRSHRNRLNRKDLIAPTDLSDNTQPYIGRYEDPTQDQGATSLSFIHQHTTPNNMHLPAFEPAASSSIQGPDGQTDGKSARPHRSARCSGND